MRDQILPVMNSGDVVVCEHIPEEGVYRLVLTNAHHMDMSVSGPMKNVPGSSMFVFTQAARFQINVPEEKFEEAMQQAGCSSVEEVKNIAFMTAGGTSYHEILDDPDATIVTLSINDGPEALN